MTNDDTHADAEWIKQQVAKIEAEKDRLKRKIEAIKQEITGLNIAIELLEKGEKIK